MMPEREKYLTHHLHTIKRWLLSVTEKILASTTRYWIFWMVILSFLAVGFIVATIYVAQSWPIIVASWGMHQNDTNFDIHDKIYDLDRNIQDKMYDLDGKITRLSHDLKGLYKWAKEFCETQGNRLIPASMLDKKVNTSSQITTEIDNISAR